MARKAKVKPEYKELVGLFEQLTGSRSMWQVFNDCIEMFALAFQDAFVFGDKFQKNEERYKQIAAQYEGQMHIVLKIFSKIVDMAEENPFRDLLGDLYMQLNMGSDTLGQFFTPYCVTQLMAQVSDIEAARAEIEQNGYVTLNEPSCGGGANVIAFCEMLYNNGINYQRQCVIACQDLSRTAALMCYVVLSLLGCAAVVKVGDTIANPYVNYLVDTAKGCELWTTPAFHLYNCYRKI